MEVLESGKHGIIVDDFRIGDALTKLLVDGKKRKEMEIRGRKHAKNFCMKRIAREYEKIYYKLIRRNFVG